MAVGWIAEVILPGKDCRKDIGRLDLRNLRGKAEAITDHPKICGVCNSKLDQETLK